MKLVRVLNQGSIFLAFAAVMCAHGDLSQDEIKLLQDTGGWEYISISEPNGGIQTVHTCFDGAPHPDQCSGTLTFTTGNTFVKNVHVQGGTDQRHGTYQLEGGQVSFFDEQGVKDGPYDLQLNLKAKSLVLQLQGLRMELQLEKAYRESQKKPKPTTP